MTYQDFSLRALAIQGIKVYQKIFSQKVPTCRYLPTCSEYAIQALEEWGFFRGLILSLWRILRCHPFAAQRVDEIPRKSQSKV